MEKSALEKFFRNELTASERQKAIRFLSNPENDLQLRHWLKENWDLITEFNAGEHQDDPEAITAWLSIQRRITAIEDLNVQSGINPTEGRRNQQEINPNQDSTIQWEINPRVDLLSITAKTPEHHQIKIVWRIGNFQIRRSMVAVAAAAILILILSAVGFLIYNKNSPGKTLSDNNEIVLAKPSDIAPPSASKAVLILANGQQIFIDSSGNGTIANEGQMSIVKTDDGQIVYKGAEASSIGYNTLSLPKGSKPLRLALSDGSIVWLNAVSSVTYPTAFIGNERKVSITGEAYFEVAKSSDQTFVVSHQGVLVKVLGTHFNVNTYEDEHEIKVTLLEGSVDVSKGGRNTILHPGQQARLSDQGTKLSDIVDLDEVMAWKNGQFYFTGTNIKTIMQQIAKYYDVEVEYQDEVPYQFVAKISRQVNVSEFLKNLN